MVLNGVLAIFNVRTSVFCSYSLFKTPWRDGELVRVTLALYELADPYR